MKLLIPLTLASMVGLGALMGPGARASASTSVVGVLAPYDVVSVGAPVDGILIATHHGIGDTVAAGAPIAS
ncbi:MAG: hypothetical protein O2816_00590, partial [Planctomycetota bacterium]|nr:hypothetical protein [Planctomycetota bacterium]